MRSFAEGVRLQAHNLQAGRLAVGEALAEAGLAPARSGTLILTGIGASWHALAPAVHALQRAGRRAYAVQPSAAAGLGDAYVLVSQSGRSTELLELMERLDGAPTIVVSAFADSPLAQAADVWLPLGPERDTAVSTLGYTATLQTLGLLTDALLGRESTWEPAAVPSLDAEAFSRVQVLDAVGAGPAAGSAGETALLAREALMLPAAAYETRQYLHGPLESVTEGYGVILFGSERERRLAGTLEGYGATVALIEDPDPIRQILPVQRLVAEVAELRGLKIDSLAREQDDTKVPA